MLSHRQRTILIIIPQGTADLVAATTLTDGSTSTPTVTSGSDSLTGHETEKASEDGVTTASGCPVSANQSPSRRNAAEFADHIRKRRSIERALMVDNESIHGSPSANTTRLPMSTKPSIPEDYWSEARRPLACLLFLLPWIAIYEAGVLMLSDSDPNNIRNGADYWMRSSLTDSGLSQILLLPTLIFVILLSWHVVRRHPWRVRLETQLGMLAESLLLAIVLIAVGQVHQLLFINFHPAPADPRLLALDTGNLTQAVSFIGAGVYEEVMFRLLLLPLVYVAFRMFDCPPKFAGAMAALSTAFVFALAHHVGPNADAFNLFAFSFRIAAGTFFAAIFFLRGFGITVGCHAAYDLMVGILLVTPEH